MKEKKKEKNKAFHSIQNDHFNESINDKDRDKQNKENKGVNYSMSIEEIIKTYKLHVPFWGGNIKYKNKSVRVINTCTIDNFLYAFWVAYKIEATFFERMPSLEHTETIKSIIMNINNLNWNQAKEFWITKIMKYNEKIANKEITLYGSESNRFIRHINEFQKHILVQVCGANCSKNKNVIIQRDCDKIYFKKIQKKVEIYSGYDDICSECQSKITCEINFENNPNFLFIESIHSNILYNDLPKIAKINGKSYKLLCSTIHQNDHFSSLFLINNFIFKIDDLDKSFINLDFDLNKRKNKILKKATSASFYFIN